jgi:hypothetical protein
MSSLAAIGFAAVVSLTISRGGPRQAITASGSRASRAPEIEVSAMAARHSRVKSSTITRMQKRRP